jgi:steroid 5-alpha reductase family enzyme
MEIVDKVIGPLFVSEAIMLIVMTIGWLVSVRLKNAGLVDRL